MNNENLDSIIFDDNKLKQLLQDYSILQLMNILIRRDDSSFIIKTLIKKVILNDGFAEVIGNNNINEAKYIFDYFELDDNDEENKNAIRELLFQKSQEDNCLKIFGLSALFSVLNMTNKQDKLYKEVEQKIINDNSFIDKILNNMDSNYLISLVIDFHINNKVDYLLLDRIVNSFMLNDDKIKSITNKYKLFQIIHKLSLISKDTHFVYTLKRNFILNNSYADSIDNKEDKQYIFDLIDIEDNYDEDSVIVKELLFDKNENDNCLKIFGFPVLISVLDMQNKQCSLYQKVVSELTNNDTFMNKILKYLDIDYLFSQLKYIELDDNQHFIFINKIFNSNLIKDTLMYGNDEDRKKLYSFIKMIIKKIGINATGAFVIETLENVLEQIDSKEYRDKDIVDSISSPKGKKHIYRFLKGSFVIAPNGDYIMINLDNCTGELKINNSTEIISGNWISHAIAIGDSLIMFGLSEEDVNLVNYHPFPVSIYGKDNGYLIIQIEGEDVIIYCPNTISSYQYKTFEAILNDFKKYELENGDSMLFSLVLKNNKFIDEMLLHNNIYLEEIIYILLKEKIVSYEIINSKSSIKK